MNNANHINSHDEFAPTYDSQAKFYNSHENEVLFGMCYEYVKLGESLLDLGIGTGLSSALFAKAGLEITGLDGSSEMLKECKKKGFAKEIKQHDIRDVPLPYADKTFSHVVCCGVFHFFGDLLPTIKDACRILKPSGIFAFTIASLAGSDPESMPDFSEHQSAWDIPVFKHSDKYIDKIAAALELTIQKEQKVLVNSGDENVGDMLFKVMVMQKKYLKKF
jgi:ubiquinone/menaquinone biosynthesis C-methylase UbiE